MAAVQFNLLPDVKLEYLKAQRLKQTVVSVSIVVAGVFLAILILLFLVVGVFQKTHLKAVNADIKEGTSKLQSFQDINKILTVQNQLNSLPGLHAKKPVTSRLFGFLTQLVPAKVDISSLAIDYSQNTVQFTGSADGIGTVNQFVDTLKFANYSLNGTTNKAFSNVVLSSFGRTEKGASYTVNATFDPVIFDSSKAINNLTIPSIVTTRSDTTTPSSLFNSSGQEAP